LELTQEEREILDGAQGRSAAKSMQILVALGTIYGAQRLLPVSSVQIAGVSYDNLGEAGLAFLDEMSASGGRAQVLATLNPAGMDVENWQPLGVSPEFAAQQQRVIDAFAKMNVITTCTCTPYLTGNLPHFGEHLAWAESSAVCYANSVLGARSNREGGPSALAAALTGRTPAYGYHLDENRRPDLLVDVQAGVEGTQVFGALGKAIGDRLQATGKKVPYMRGIEQASLEELKALCASLATFGGTALFHMQGVTPEAGQVALPIDIITIESADLQQAVDSLNDADPAEVDFVSLGCPHLSLREVAHLAELLGGRRVRGEFWITTARPIKQIADRMGYTRVIEASGAKFAADTCCVVTPLQGRFHAIATDSAKACYYAASKHRFKTLFKSFDEIVLGALEPQVRQ
jgi:predicted aconitase